MVAQPTNVAPIQLNLSPRDCYFAIRHCSSRSLWSSWTHTVKDGVAQSFDVLVLAFGRVLMLLMRLALPSGNV
jgi:hypothetical protein